ncbi:4-hydroxy-tetrahydrodipicolinate synthase [Carboxydothermus hydrogenoformans]|uniref:4-hydroxy-tetrahydrodipicolinate synthase n=1 Tax=Carboxydothermus hydrogenoformans (strain ATCC BAA-161 / DSM 6008 / Z-2901) TaxID=246194 RepID=Q3ACI0_CARHZ|nr:4-hydroxy-tetrahydrodipicolinate synthase [Carboxydothermus hydrogenoformans]ABB14175.1 dihydrodipicolinate synthase [Carboxydothermus hydrogenoformans Z-2901]
MTEILNKFRGVIPPMLTIFKEDGTFDWEGNKALIDFLINGGVHGIFVLGSSGEFSHLNAEERKEFAKFVVDYVAGRVPVLVGTGSSNTKEVVELTKHAKEIGADGVVVVSPYYWGLSEKNLYQHFATVAKVVDIPIVLYNFPDLTGQNLSPSLVAKLASDFPNIVGIKDTIDSIAHIRELILQVKTVRPDFSVLAGYDDHLFNTLAMGGDGVIPGTANFAPHIPVNIYNNFVKGNIEESMNWHRKLLRLPRIYSLDKPAISLLKEACKLCGLPVESYIRQPAGRADEAAVENLKTLLREAGLIK